MSERILIVGSGEFACMAARELAALGHEVALSCAAPAKGDRRRLEGAGCDLLEGFSQKTDLLIANLPYIPSEKLRSLRVFLTEPKIALDGGPDGLHYIKRMLESAQDLIKPGGAIFLELDEDCGAAALALAKNIYPGARSILSQDLSRQDRYLAIYL